jgi:hypothetical protein
MNPFVSPQSICSQDNEAILAKSDGNDVCLGDLAAISEWENVETVQLDMLEAHSLSTVIQKGMYSYNMIICLTEIQYLCRKAT